MCHVWATIKYILVIFFLLVAGYELYVWLLWARSRSFFLSYLFCIIPWMRIKRRKQEIYGENRCSKMLKIMINLFYLWEIWSLFLWWDGSFFAGFRALGVVFLRVYLHRILASQSSCPRCREITCWQEEFLLLVETFLFGLAPFWCEKPFFNREAQLFLVRIAFLWGEGFFCFREISF